jgi:uncharacterized protein
VSARRAFLTAEWRWLVMLNFDVAPECLAALVPEGTTLDLWRGRTLASVVGFQFLRTRVAGIPLPFHQRFEEVNLRFYVKRETGTGEVRRGVTFIRELVPRTAVALVARLAYNEPYRAVPMRSTSPGAPGDVPRRVAYQWRTGGRWQHVAATATGRPEVPAPDDLGAFITEHYWGYGRLRDGATGEYEVTHPAWRVWATETPEFTGDIAEIYGPAFSEALSKAPTSAFIAEGSPVAVYPVRRLPRIL